MSRKEGNPLFAIEIIWVLTSNELIIPWNLKSIVFYLSTIPSRPNNYYHFSIVLCFVRQVMLKFSDKNK